MKRTDKTTLRWLRVCHMLTAPLWFGGAVSALVTGDMVLYPKLILPAALLTVLAGLLYGGTPWGFFRFKWITAKWVLTLLALPLAVFCAIWRAAPPELVNFAQAVQAILLAAAMVTAILKPGGKKVVLFTGRKRERTDEELREEIEKDRRPL